MTVAQDKDFAAYLKEARSFDYDSRIAAERSTRLAELRLRSISFLNDGLAQVRFYKTEVTEREDLRARSLWVSTIEFDFDAAADISAEDRTINPLGFVVSSYRADPEVTE
jgi:type IV secretory pathway component VirB8